ncbi:phosphoenolpyruvate--protein phosphotransferase, partial [Plesiomonas shigelloides]|nr:phosphoenolpyruvate--protein phosphotransferase [Plesiomonas shigelloides]
DLPYLNLLREMNPFLGGRAIRICLDRREILRTRLRAILRASAFGKLRILFPMVISVEEVRTRRAERVTLKLELTAEGHAFDGSIEVGVMVETPATAAIAPQPAEEVEFLSIRTNHLNQYTTALNRGK